MSLLAKGLRHVGKILAEELVRTTASNLGNSIGTALGRRAGKKIDPTWDPDKTPSDVAAPLTGDKKP